MLDVKAPRMAKEDMAAVDFSKRELSRDAEEQLCRSQGAGSELSSSDG